MTTGRCQPIDHAVSPLLPADSGDRLERLKKVSGLSWWELAGSIGVTERDAILWRWGERPRSGPGHRAIVALARDLPGGLDLIAAAADDDCYDHDGHGG